MNDDRFFCSACGEAFDGNEIVTLAWLRSHTPDAARFHRNEPAETRFSCGTICPHCGHANDAPGLVEADCVPHVCDDGMVVCAFRYIPPQPVIDTSKWYGEGYEGPR